MSSRLFQQVREDRGLAYSVYAALYPYADAGIFYVYAATARRESAAAAQLIEEILADAAETAHPARARRGCAPRPAPPC